MTSPSPVSGWEAERERLRKALASLGFGTEEKIGWRGRYPAPSTDAHFRCEFCHAENLNCDEIAHTDECPVTICRAALSESKEQTTADGWIEWKGGECPVADADKVEIRMRDGTLETRAAADFRWNRHGWPGDIIAFRVVTP